TVPRRGYRRSANAAASPWDAMRAGLLLVAGVLCWSGIGRVEARFQGSADGFAGVNTTRRLLPPEQFCQSLGCSCILEQRLACQLESIRITAIPQLLTQERANKITDM
ncbi:hypothetical protein V5799_024719, partial [Amblyomma americanum]